MFVVVTPSSLRGELIVPSSKSHTLRAILFASLAKGRSEIREILPSPDTKAMIASMQLLGVNIEGDERFLRIEGIGGIPKVAEDVIQCGNSGQVFRFVGALAGLIPQYTVLTGDLSIRHNRPVLPLLDGLQQLGAFAVSCKGNGHAPIAVRGPFLTDRAVICGKDSQPVSGLLIASALAPHPIELEVKHPGEKPWIDLTLSWFQRLGIPYVNQNYCKYQMRGGAQIAGFSYTVPGDFSTAAFLIAAALITGSELTLHNLDMNDVQGDKKILFILQEMGAFFQIDFCEKSVTVLKGGQLQGIRIDVNDCIDALPILAV
ncbi:MAG: 3-phosphoshikimate 1-carboxyvinyltransferase, partial [Chlamydiia bacterium]|nr:3-phosphoshikimate 1-carboxyvinyltransferase [Chlamydiia bacterium]